MSLTEFTNHLYRCVWNYLIKETSFAHNYHKDYGNVMEPEDFYPQAVWDLFNDLDRNKNFNKTYEELTPSIPVELRNVLLEFMPWYNRLTKLSIEESYNTLSDAARVGDPELDKLTAFVRSQVASTPLTETISIPAKTILNNVFNNFTSSISSLKTRRKDKPTIELKDEYDVQDLLLALLKPHFPEIRSEEVVSGNIDRQFMKIDFDLSSDKIAIECKFIRDKDHARKITSEINDDIQTYHQHPDCSLLIFFIYDPDMHISSPMILVEKYSGTQSFNGKEVQIEMIIRPSN